MENIKGMFTDPARFRKGWAALVTLSASSLLLFGIDDETTARISAVAVNVGTLVAVVLFPNDA